MRDIFTDESIRLAVGLDGWILDIARDKWAVDEEMTMDENFKVYTEFIAKHWHLQPHEVTYSDLQTVKRKICQLFSISDSLSKVCLDWNFDDDENYRYKFDIERRKHSLEKGMWILLSVWGSPCREQTGIITEVLPDGIIIQADGYVDTSEEYSIMKIEKPVVYQENGLL